MKKQSKFISSSLSTLSVILILFVWQLYAIHVDNPFLMPTPTNVLKSLLILLGEGRTYFIILTTLVRLAVSVLAASIAGLILGLLAGVFYQVEAFLKPLVTTLRTLPVVSIIVVILILYGNVFSLYLISFLLLFPIIYQAELEGIKNIDQDLLDVLSLECNNCPFVVVRLVYFPLAMPYFKTAMIQSTGLAIKVLVVAEYLSQTQISIGRELYFNRINLEYANVFAWTIILILVAIIIEHYIQKYVKGLKK
ncbi:MAG: ABC transporter permease subunit [Bacilli bacterium]|nr:ABC transporter permease subunit [Bacilli bacterium]